MVTTSRELLDSLNTFQLSEKRNSIGKFQKEKFFEREFSNKKSIQR